MLPGQQGSPMPPHGAHRPMLQKAPAPQVPPAQQGPPRTPQGVHMPVASQTPPAHEVPAGSGVVGMQTGAPEVHTMAPLRHGVLGVHVIPAAHGMHAPPPSQTPPGHVVPAAALPPGMHTA